MKILLIWTILFVSFAALSVGAADTDKIIGDNDLVPVLADGSNIPLKYRPLLDAFGMISSMYCTATHIGGGYVLTAGHCFFAGEDAQIDKSCAGDDVEWGRRDGVEPYMISKCEKIVLAQRIDMNDYAIIKVSPIPPVAIAPEMNRRAIIGDTITVFSHPNKQNLRWSRLCGIERLQHPELPIGSIQHKCDTNPGSSGATLINALTLKVVGIHDGGLDGYPGDSDPDSATSTGMNYGTFLQNSPLWDKLRELGFN